MIHYCEIEKTLSFLLWSWILEPSPMEKQKNSSVWTEEGYRLFAKEGLYGIQVERLARILSLNKSGFYHYFGDIEGYCSALVKLHVDKVGEFLQEVAVTKKLDPDYLHLLLKHREMIMFQVQLTRNSGNNSFYAASEIVDLKVSEGVRQLWCDYLEVSVNSDFGIRYYAIVRDMFYTRIPFQNLNFTFLHNLVTDAKKIMNAIGARKAFEAEESFH